MPAARFDVIGLASFVPRVALGTWIGTGERPETLAPAVTHGATIEPWP